ncbi:TIGR04211 family SH3 domain-containing protein [Thalassotalea sp. ND16A]|uniref:TIGR04211 family SH3 domain-containing protein n=1 Tax=Thalassotalea sp. ND16A TaxID=1535422 RepID=UPI00051A0AEE|nr:TIGR04211 family SH3 domain-containing protein [Thalassotalea sp. ND16A]KGJ89294.1 hypothetical protein ND16A_2187 [Thalassotalea sp. ND16A]
MNYIQKIIILLTIGLSCSVIAEEDSANVATNQTAFISDDLFIYFHSGPGTQYRILGSIDAGEDVQLLGEVENGYQHVKDLKNRDGWVDAKYISPTPGLRVVLAELNEELVDKSRELGELKTKLSNSNKQLNSFKQDNQKLTKQNQEITQKFELISAELDENEWDIKLTWFSYGAAVLVIGLIIGLVLPRFIARKSSYSSWN